MATFKQGILGGFSGKIGGAIGSSWKGINVMRSMPVSVANPRTTPQVNQRTKFAAIVAVAAACLTTIIKPLNDRFAQYMSGFNAFVQRSRDAFTGAGVFVPASLFLSSGKLGDPRVTGMGMVDASNASVTWDPTVVGSYEAATDLAYILLIDNLGVVRGTSAGVVTRADDNITITLGTPLGGAETLYGYLSFLREDGSIVSNSAYQSAVAP